MNEEFAKRALQPVPDHLQNLKERERRAEEERALLEYHGIYGTPQNRHERRKAAKVLRTKQ